MDGYIINYYDPKSKFLVFFQKYYAFPMKNWQLQYKWGQLEIFNVWKSLNIWISLNY